jgi:uncharacterized protein YjbJ (UPF0337 family)
MNRDRANGMIDEAVGSAKRKVGGLTGNTPLQIKGLAQQAKGKLESALGKIEDADNGSGEQSNQPRDQRP